VTHDLVIGCDSGTRSVKAIVMTMKGARVAAATEPHSDVTVTADGGAEQDAPSLLHALERVLGRCIAAAGARRVAAVALTTQRDGIVPLNGARPARPMFTWMDRRAPNPVRWLSRHEPDIAARVTAWTTLSAYMHLHLCDRLVDSAASLPVSFPIDRWAPGWSDDDGRWRAAGLKRSSVHAIVPAGSIVGHISRRASRRTGLSEGTPIVATGGDKNCEVLGGGALDPAAGVLSLGTALSVGTMVGDSRRFRSAPLWTTAAPIAGWWTVEAGIPGGLWTLDWLARAFPQKTKRRVRPPTRDGLLVVPYWLGHVSRPDARGVIAGLGPHHDGGDLRRAAMEGLAFEARRAAEAIERASGHPMREISMVGGGTSNRMLCAIVAAVLARRVRIAHDVFTGARGAAAVASLALRPGAIARAHRFSGEMRNSPVDRRFRRDYARLYEHYRAQADEALLVRYRSF
jgi:sugar (pentulose or hexulose) kinase